MRTFIFSFIGVVSFLIVGFLSFANVFALEANLNNDQVLYLSNVSVCQDTDGGYDIYTKGTMTRTDRSGTLPDHCYIKDGGGYTGTSVCNGDDCYVNEAYCEADLGYQIDFPSYFISCPQGCSDGACLRESSDKIIIKRVWTEKDLESSSFSNFNSGQYVLFAEIVDEKSDPIPKSDSIDFKLVASAPNSSYRIIYGGIYDSPIRNYFGQGYWSSSVNISTCGDHQYTLTVKGDNAVDTLTGNFILPCINACNDQDGEDYNIKGYVTDQNSAVKNDVCRDDSKLIEYICNTGNAEVVTRTCLYGCSDGKCNATESFSSIRPGWLIKNKSFAEVFYVDSDMKLRWITNEAAAVKYFGVNWVQNINEFINLDDSNLQFGDKISETVGIYEFDDSVGVKKLDSYSFLDIQPGWLIKNKSFAEVFYVDSDMKLRWITNEVAAVKHFGLNWTQNIKEFSDLSSSGLLFGEKLN